MCWVFIFCARAQRCARRRCLFWHRIGPYLRLLSLYSSSTPDLLFTNSFCSPYYVNGHTANAEPPHATQRLAALHRSEKQNPPLKNKKRFSANLAIKHIYCTSCIQDFLAGRIPSAGPFPPASGCHLQRCSLVLLWCTRSGALRLGRPFPHLAPEARKHQRRKRRWRAAAVSSS